MLERNLQQTAIRKFQDLRARDQTFVFRKRHGSSFGVAGDPDLYGLWNGIAWNLELKQPGESPTPLQRARGEEWFIAGSVMGVARSPADIDEFLSDLEMIVKHHGTALIAARREVRDQALKRETDDPKHKTRNPKQCPKLVPRPPKRET